MNQWVLTPAEARQNDGQFESLQPSNGFVTGDQVRPYFMRSGLPPQLLAQIWSLSDLTKDGRMDKIEFNIATHLIRKSLAGFPLPPQIPDSLISSARQHSMVPPPMAYVPQPVTPQPYPLAPTAAPGRPPSVPASFPNKTLSDWTIPQSAKLKYSQQFNQLDSSRVGLLTGSSVRGILARSQLPTAILAEIWNLSDANKDGCLSNEEFCIAMHLIEMFKMGYMLPPTLPDELLNMCHVAINSSSPLPDISQPPAQKTHALKTFEDKRKDNYDRGQAELDRRRQVLLEEEERRKQELQRKEQEEAARRERERQELERKREMEREMEMKRQQELEEARQAEERKIKAEKAEARRKLELQRQQELDQMRIRSLETNKRNEEEKNMHLKQRLKTLTFQKQALDEKAVQLNDDITSNRNDIITITREIEGMKEKRDRSVAAINMLVTKTQELSISCQQVSHQVLQAQSDGKLSNDQDKEIKETRNMIESSCQTVEMLKGQIQQYDTNIPQQRAILVQRTSSRDEAKAQNGVEEQAVNTLLCEIEQAQRLLRERLAATRPSASTKSPVSEQSPDIVKNTTAQTAGAYSISSGSNANGAVNLLPSMDAATVKYRALYEFIARTDDELSFQPGDIILVFEGHPSEPGWLAGQIREKVGWFPQAFAEPVVVTNPAGKVNIRKKSVPTSPSSEPLESILEEDTTAIRDSTVGKDLPEALPVYDDVPGNIPASNGVTSSVICKAVAQYQWKARNPDDMSFAKGDEIEILEKQDIKWRGRLANNNSVTGWFPKSYVKVVEEAEPSVSPSEQKNEAVAVHPLAMYDVVPDTTKPADKEGSTKNESGDWYIALYAFEAIESNDLPLKPGDRIWVTESSDDWWKGVSNGKVGTFPANYVQKESVVKSAPGSPTAGILQTGVAVAAFEAMESNQLSLKVGDKVTICSKSENGWWEGEKRLENGERATGWFPGNYVRVDEASAKPASSGESALADALFDYAAAREDELSFKEGDVIEVVDRSDVQWWKGRLHSAPNSAVMLFPSSFVRIR
uniref:Intersectin-1 n=1 Tax=Steinernema glaseri TaxID=37863 RepID=A0A1I8AD92_9BILA